MNTITRQSETDALQERIGALMSENVRLKIALKEIAESTYPMGANANDGFATWRRFAHLAREALKGKAK